VVIQQGDVLWVRFPPARGSGPAGRRPAVVMQHDRFNRSRLATTVVVAITSNPRCAALPGNVRLRRDEAGLARPSVVNVTQVATVDRADLAGRLGRLSSARLGEVWQGLQLVLAPDA
jgi:mRNA interferase MazF